MRKKIFYLLFTLLILSTNFQNNLYANETFKEIKKESLESTILNNSNISNEPIQEKDEETPKIVSNSEEDQNNYTENNDEVEPTEDIDDGSDKTAIIGKTVDGLPKSMENSNVSFYAVDLTNGKVLANVRGNKVAIPASIMKVITSATALETLGKEKQLETKVFYSGKIDTKGVLTGNIYIKGGGDPTLGSSATGANKTFLKDWSNAIKNKGITKVQGNIIVLDGLFGYEGIPKKWLLEDIGSNYGQAVYGISVYDNTFTVSLTSTANDIKINKVTPNVPNLNIKNNLKLIKAGKNDFYVRALPFDNNRYLVGTVRQNLKNIIIKSDIPNPGLLLGTMLKNELNSNKITVTGKILTQQNGIKIPDNLQLLYTTKSPALKEIIRILLKKSNNHYTEHLYQLMRINNIDIPKYWQQKGLDISQLVMYDGSGLSRSNYISAKFLTDLLVYMYKNDPILKDLLPRGGYEGTVVGFMVPKAFNGVAKIKSGSMKDIQAYSGYLDKDNKKIAFTIIINHWKGSRYSLKRDMEKMLLELFEDEKTNNETKE